MINIYCGALVSSDYLEHHGIKGMRWGVRRFQREDGSLTSVGKKRKLMNERKNEAGEHKSALKSSGSKVKKESKTSDSKRGLSPAAKKRIAIGAAAVVAVAGTYAAYKIYDKRVPKYIDVGKTIVNTKKVSFSEDLAGKLPNGPSASHPNKILKQTFTMDYSYDKTEKSTFNKSVPNPNRRFFAAKGKNKLSGYNSSLNRLAKTDAFSDPKKNEAAKRINEKFASDVDDVVKAYRSGKISRKDYAARLNELQSKVDLSDIAKKKKRR